MALDPDSAAAASSDWSAPQPQHSVLASPITELKSALLSILDNSDVDVRDRQEMLDPIHHPNAPSRDALLVLLPLLIILSSLLFLLLLFLICVLLIRRRRGIILRDSDGPIDLSREDSIEGDGGFVGVEERWLESVNEETRRSYARAKGQSTTYKNYWLCRYLNIGFCQNFNSLTLLTRCLPTSPSPNFFPSRRKAYPLGHSSTLR